MPVPGAVSCLCLAVYSVVDNPMVALRAVLLVLAGIVLWFISRAAKGRMGAFDAKKLDG